MMDNIYSSLCRRYDNEAGAGACVNDFCVDVTAMMLVLQQNGMLSVNAQRNLTITQWVECNVLPLVTGSELCAGSQPADSSPGVNITLQSGTALLQHFLGNASAADAQ